jgi:hypothetical protein
VRRNESLFASSQDLLYIISHICIKPLAIKLTLTAVSLL